MPPTIQSGKHGDRAKSRSTVPKRSDIVCRIKYLNKLPDIPFDPKFIKYPFDGNRFVEYNATSLERNYKHELLAEHDLGVTIDLINPETYKIDPNAVLDPKDERLLEEEISTPGDSKRSQRHKRSVSWLRKTEYISSEYSRSQPSSEKPETKVAFTLKKKFNEEEIYQDRSNQIIAIQKTFEDAKKPIEKHYSKPFVTPVEILPVFPDFETWIHPCAQVNFDSDPSLRGKTTAGQLEEMSQAMIRGMVDESDEQFVGYFLPSDDTMGKRKRDFEEEVDYREDEGYEYKLSREYNWNVKNKASKGYEENYFFLFRKGKGVFFNELETRVRLSKRRVKEGLSSNSVLVVKHRELSEQEMAVQEARLSQLENILPEEEEEEEEDAEGETGQGSGEENEEGEEQETAEGSGEDGSGDEGRASPGSDKEDNNEEGAAQTGSDAEEQAGSDTGEQEGSDAGEQAASGGEQEGSGGEQESGDEATGGDEEEMEHDGGQEETADSDRGEDGGDPETRSDEEETGHDSDRGSADGGDRQEGSDTGEQEEGQEGSDGEAQGESSDRGGDASSDRGGQEGGSDQGAQGSDDEEEDMEQDQQEDHRKEDEQEIFGGDSDEDSVVSA